MSERILVIGAGYIGSAFAGEAVRQGKEVYALRRRISEQSIPGVMMVQGDVTALNDSDVAKLPEGIGTVVVTIAPTSMDDGYEETYVRGIQGAIDLAKRYGTRRLLYTSSTGVYSANNGEVVDESSNVHSGDDMQGVIRRSELLALESPMDTVILRLSGLYGPGRDPRPRYRDIAALAAGGEYWTNRIHRDDAVGGILFMLEKQVQNEIYNCTDDEPAQAISIARWLAEQEGRPVTTPPTADGKPRSSKRIQNEKLRALGWKPEYPTFREGFRLLDP